MAEYIERDDIEYPYMTMSMWGINSATCHAYNEGVKATEDAIKAIPTADVVEVRHGEWVKNESVADVCGEYRCSLCGFMYCEADPKWPPYKYCPECGAKNE